MSLERWGLSADDIPQLVQLAGQFHQDVGQDRTSLREALDRYVGWLSAPERERLGEDLERCLRLAPSPDEFARLFVAAGARGWPAADDPRDELADWLGRQA